MHDLSFIKMQAAGNDFVLLDAVDGRRRNWPALARRLCDRHFGVGADGLLVVQKVGAAFAKAAGVRFCMRMFNPDGSEDMCGNGLRCVAAFTYRAGYNRSRCFFLQTLTGLRQVVLNVARGEVQSVKANLGPPRLRGKEIPVSVDLESVVDHPLRVGENDILITALSTGTPHAIVFGDSPADLGLLGPQIMQHPFFPEQTSVSWARVENGKIHARTWERGGVGESLSCGTGGTAILAAAHLKGLTPRQAEIIYPGGRLYVSWDCNGDLWIAGPAEEVFRGNILIRR